MPGFTSAELANGKPSVVNFWASWCVPCAEEQPLLVELQKRTGVALYGVNYKDDAASARRFLGRYGNPFTAVGTDDKGRAAIEWGVYGMPETFVLNGKGEIVFKHVGPVTPQSMEQKLMPAIARAQAAAPPQLAHRHPLPEDQRRLSDRCHTVHEPRCAGHDAQATVAQRALQREELVAGVVEHRQRAGGDVEVGAVQRQPALVLRVGDERERAQVA